MTAGRLLDARAVRIGTRGSALALAQAKLVADAFAGRGVRHEIVVVHTEGDRRAPDTAWGEGAFVTAIERALLDGRVDVAVHSAKDIPTEEDPRLSLVAFLPREDPRDALVLPQAPSTTASGNLLDRLPAGTVVGTDSPRRTAFLRARRPDIDVRPLHGNVDTRLRRLDAGEVDALVLAVAGLCRLGHDSRISQRLEAEIVPPAPGQGAICIQARADDMPLADLGASTDHLPTRLAVEAERAFLRAAGGGCRAPIGALAEVRDGRLRLLGGFATVDGGATAVDAIEGPVDSAPGLAEELAARLSALRARLAGGRKILVTRPAGQGHRLAARLGGHGLAAVVVPAFEIVPDGPGGPLDSALTRLAEHDWAAVTSANGARAVGEAAARVGVDLAAVRWAAVGDATSRELRRAGVGEAWQPSTASADALARELPVKRGEHVLLIRGSLADAALPDALRARGATVREVVAYRTLEAPASSRALLARALAGGPPAAVIFTSPSAVRGLIALAGEDLHAAVVAIPAIAIGPTTAAAVRDAGLALLGKARSQDTATLAELTAELVAQRAGRMPEGVAR